MITGASSGSAARPPEVRCRGRRPRLVARTVRSSMRPREISARGHGVCVRGRPPTWSPSTARRAVLADHRTSTCRVNSPRSIRRVDLAQRDRFHDFERTMPAQRFRRSSLSRPAAPCASEALEHRQHLIDRRADEPRALRYVARRPRSTPHARDRLGGRRRRVTSRRSHSAVAPMIAPDKMATRSPRSHRQHDDTARRCAATQHMGTRPGHAREVASALSQAVARILHLGLSLFPAPPLQASRTRRISVLRGRSRAPSPGRACRPRAGSGRARRWDDGVVEARRPAAI